MTSTSDLVVGVGAADGTTEYRRVSWEALAYQHLLNFARLRDGEAFYTRELRAYAYACGLPQPERENAWGGVLKRASTRGMIRKTRNYAPGSKAKWVVLRHDLV